MAVILYSLFSSLWKSGPNILITDVNDEEYITSLNAKGLSFKVGPTPMFEGYKLADAKKLINNLATNKEQLYRCHTGNKDTIVPDTYNFRKAYPSCAREIVTQGNCSSSYTLAAVGMITDRWCRKNELSFPRLSPQTPLACDKVVNSHCKGGFLSRTLDYAKLYGLVEEQCYSYNPVLDAEEECLKKVENCEKFKIADYCVASDMENVKQEIYNYGPVATILTVYRDFLVYK